MINTAFMLVAAGVNDVIPARELLEPVIQEGMLPALFEWSKYRGVEGIIATVLERANKEYSGDEDFIDEEQMRPWLQARAGIIQKIMKLDTERSAICSWMDEQGIWYVPLKGIVLKELYPRMGMRSMVDNDILFDDTYAAELNKFMIDRGYRGLHVGASHDDGYLKEPIYNYEMHRSSANPELMELLDGEHHMSEEAFYVHLIEHAHHHYIAGGIGIRTLADIYVYRHAKTSLDWSGIARMLEMRDLAGFGDRLAELADKQLNADVLKNGLPELGREEMDMFCYMLDSAVIGTRDNIVANYLKVAGGNKLHAIVRRTFPPYEKMKSEYNATRLTLPYWYAHRLIARRNLIKQELDKLKEL